MGIIVSYEVTNNKNLILEIEKNKNSNFDIESFLNKNRDKIKSFSTFVKSWNPLYSLLSKISGNKIFDKLSEYKSGNNFDEYIKLFESKEVNILYDETKKITESKIRIALKNDSLKTEISKDEGYNMDYIFDEDSIITEFNELKDAINFAYHSNSKLIQILFP